MGNDDTGDPRETWDDIGGHVPEVTGPIDPWSIVVEQLAELRRDARDQRRAQRADLGELRRDLGSDIHGLSGQVAVLVAGYQRQGVQIGEHMAACHERHRRDSDEVQAASARAHQIAEHDKRLKIIEETGVARLNWRRQWIALVSVAIAAVAAGAALVRLFPL